MYNILFHKIFVSVSQLYISCVIVLLIIPLLLLILHMAVNHFVNVLSGFSVNELSIYFISLSFIQFFISVIIFSSVINALIIQIMSK